MKNHSLKITLLLVILGGWSTQFHKMGHMVVARIAEIELQGTRIYDQMMEVLGLLTKYTKERDYPFIETAPYADDIKALGVKTMNHWHFADHYINGDRLLTDKELDAHKIKKNPENLVWSINESKKILRNKNASLIDDRLNKSIYLRMLIHLYGDLHQPLHGVSYVDEKKFKKGDAGGNKFVIDLVGARDLHTLWDKCVKRCKEVSVPLKKNDYDLIDIYAKHLMKRYTRSTTWVKKRLQVTSVKEISDESVQLAIKEVYAGVKFGKPVGEEYLKKGGLLSDKQLLIAGYRLSDALKKLFEDEEVLKPHIKTEGKLEDQATEIEAVII